MSALPEDGVFPESNKTPDLPYTQLVAHTGDCATVILGDSKNDESWNILGPENLARKMLTEKIDTAPDEVFEALHPSKLDPVLYVLSELGIGQHFFEMGIAGMKEGNALYSKELVDEILAAYYEKCKELVTGHDLEILSRNYKSFMGKDTGVGKRDTPIGRRKDDIDRLFEGFQVILDSVIPEDVSAGILKVKGHYGAVELSNTDTEKDNEIIAVIRSIQFAKSAIERSIQGISSLKEYNPFLESLPHISFENEETNSAYIKNNVLYLKDRGGSSYTNIILSEEGALTQAAIDLFLCDDFPKNLAAYDIIHKRLLEVDYMNLYQDEIFDSEKYRFTVENNMLYIEGLAGTTFYMELSICDPLFPNEKILQLIKDGFIPEEMLLAKTLAQLTTFASVHAEAIIDAPWTDSGLYTSEDLENFEKYCTDYEENKVLHKLTNQKGLLPESVFNFLIHGEEGTKIITDIKALGNGNKIGFLKAIHQFSSGLEGALLDGSGNYMTDKMQICAKTTQTNKPDILLAMGGDEKGVFTPETQSPEDAHDMAFHSLENAGLSGRVIFTNEKVNGPLTYELEDKFAAPMKKMEKVIDKISFRIHGEIGFYTKLIESGGLSQEGAIHENVQDDSTIQTILADLTNIERQLSEFKKFSIERVGEQGLVRFTGDTQVYVLDDLFDTDVEIGEESLFMEVLHGVTGGLYRPYSLAS